jgi:hypothetical protein
MKILLNGKSIVWSQDKVHYLDVVQVAGYELEDVVTITYCFTDGRNGSLFKGQSVTAENRMMIEADITGDA